MARARMAVGVLVAAASVSSHVAAQDKKSFSLDLGAAVEHHTNVARSSKTQAELRGLEQEDTIFTPTASFDALLPIGRQSLFLNGSVGYSFYDSNTSLNRERMNLAGGGVVRVGPCSTTLSANYQRGLNLVDNPIIEDDVRNVQENKSIGVDVGCSAAAGFGVTASAFKDWSDNELDFLKMSDFERQRLRAGVSYGRPTFGSISLFVGRDETTYSNRLVDDGYDMDTLGVTYSRRFGARIEGDVTIAQSKIRPKVTTAFLGNREYQTYAANLSYRANSRLRFSGGFERSIMPSSGILRSYDLTESYKIQGDYDIGSRLLLSLGAARTDRASEGALLSPVNDLTDSRLTAFFGTLRYRQSDRLSFVLRLGQEERTTNAPQFDYENSRVGLGADLSF